MTSSHRLTVQLYLKISDETNSIFALEYMSESNKLHFPLHNMDEGELWVVKDLTSALVVWCIFQTVAITKYWRGRSIRNEKHQSSFTSYENFRPLQNAKRLIFKCNNGAMWMCGVVSPCVCIQLWPLKCCFSSMAENANTKIAQYARERWGNKKRICICIFFVPS